MDPNHLFGTEMLAWVKREQAAEESVEVRSRS